jgi:hypothetical protein
LEACARRKEVTIKSEYLLLCNTQNFKNVHILSENVNISPKNDDISKQSKVKESKVKESIDILYTSADASEVVKKFNLLCPSLPKVVSITDARRTAINKAAERIGGMDKFDELFARIEASDFLSGRSGKWRNCGFDWCLKAGNLVKICEGQYDNREKAVPKEDSEYEKMVEAYLPTYRKKRKQ